jgi:Phage integrase, N-terminal SAM-like domain
MTDTAISPLRRRMIEDMTIRQLKPTTQHNYIRFVKEFSIFFGRSPDKAAFEDVRRYQLHLTSRGVSPGSINGAMAALKFFFRVTVQRSTPQRRASLAGLGERATAAPGRWHGRTPGSSLCGTWRPRQYTLTLWLVRYEMRSSGSVRTRSATCTESPN